MLFGIFLVSLIIPAKSGNTPRARFCNIYIIPKPVPSKEGGQIIGIVGTIIVQNIEMQIPSKATGTQGIIFESLMLASV